MKDLVKKYEKLGVKLWVEDGKLKFRAPKGVITQERKIELKKNKEKIINFLLEIENIEHDEENRYDTFPLTDIQAAYLVGRNDEYGSGGVGCKVYLELVGKNIDNDKLNNAWKKVIFRHDMMRAIINKNGTQQVLENIEIPDIRFVNESVNVDIEDIRKEFLNKNYDSQTWPLYDICLLHQKDTDILCLSIDMLIADFTSITILLDELERLYLGEELVKLPEITFRDVVINKVFNENKKADKSRKYWIDRLDSIPLAPDLPIINEHPDTTEVIQKNLTLTYEDWEKIEIYAKDNKLTATSLVLNIYADIISKWSTDSNFTINVTMADRRNPKSDVSGLVGDFTIVNLLEIRHDNNLNFLQRAERIQKQLWSDLENIDFSGVSVIRELKRVRENNLFPIVFTSTLGFKREKGIKKSEVFKLNYKISKTPQVWIDCQISEEKNGILVNWDVRDGIFPDGMIDDAFSAFNRELRAFAENPNGINEYKYKHNINVQKIRYEVNNTIGSFSNGLLYDEWLDNVKNNPDSVAIIDNGKEYTYKKMYVCANQIANALKNKNIKEGTVVAVDVQKSMWSIASALGIMIAGGVYLPLDITQPLDRKIEILKQVNTDYGIYYGKTDLFFDNGINITELNEELNIDLMGEVINVRQNSLNPAYIIFTSGSTGKPKGVIVSHRAAKNTIFDINERFLVGKEDKVLAIADNAFDLSIYDIFGLISVGGTIVIPQCHKRKDPQHWYELIKKHNITIWNSVPAQMQILTTYVLSIKDKLTSLRLTMLSGDWIPIYLPEEIFEITQRVSVVAMGGATEASIWSNYYEISRNEKFDISVPYGKPLKNQRLYILDKNMYDCPNWIAGELYIGGIGLADGYKNNQEETMKRFVIHPVTGERLYKTGDMGRYLPDGNIEFLGRVDNQVKIRGHRIEIQEIENKLKDIDGINNAVISVRKNDGKAVGLDAFVELETSLDRKNLIVDQDELGKAVKKSGDVSTTHIDRELFYSWTKRANITALYDIFAYLKDEGLFLDESYYTIEEIYKKIKVHDYYKQLIRRWIKVLSKEQFIEYSEEKNAYKCLRHDINRQTSVDSWKKWWNIENKMHYGKKLVEYFQDSSNHLPQLVRGEIDALDIFFPQGDFTIAKAAYHDNLLSSALNKVIISTIHYIYDKLNKNGIERKIKILEIGAGVGGASLDVIPALEGYNVSYMFTDVSQYFLNAARNNFSPYDFVTYSLFDINKPYWEQGVSASQFDLVICNNVLHNARNLPDVLQSFREILSPGGAFIIEDTAGENYSLLTSMEFHAGLSQFEDFRKDSNEVFITREQWRDALEEADAAISLDYPMQNDLLVEAKQVVFIGQFINRTNLISKENILNEISKKIPEYMVPNSIQIMDKIPTNVNGKIDRKAMDSMIIKDENKVENSGNKLKEGLESRIGEIWIKALNKETIYRDEDFYKAGGDSLLLAQIVSQMKEKVEEFSSWEWNKIMTSIIQNPTVEGIANKAYENSNIEILKESERKDSAIRIIKEIDKSDRVIVIFHDGTGTLSPYNSLISNLKNNSKYSIIGMYVNDVKSYIKYEDDTLLKELGIKYAHELLKTKYNKFCLVGYCMGGLVAIETAKNLFGKDIEVEPVITIDTTPADPRIRNDILIERTFGMLIGADLTKCGYTDNQKLLKSALLKMLEEDDEPISIQRMSALDGEFEEIGKNTRQLLKKTSDERLHLICENIIRLNKEEISSYQYEQMNDLYGVISKSFSGMSLYGDELFTGDVIALDCKDKTSNFLPVLETQNQKFWETITLGDLKRINIDGDHISCMQQPFVDNISKFILSIEGEK